MIQINDLKIWVLYRVHSGYSGKTRSPEFDTIPITASLIILKLGINYSYLSAVIGSNLDALAAG